MLLPGNRRCASLLASLLVTVLCAGLSVTVAVAPASAAQTAGVQTHLLWGDQDDADRERQLDRVRAAGAGMVRVDLGWASLEQDGKGRWNRWYLDKVDHVVSAAQERGIEVLFTFWETPCWASTAPAAKKQGCRGAWWERGVQRYPPADARDYGEALAFMVARYGDRVRAWELWNEPNHSQYFVSDDQAGEYAKLVRAAYPRAKAADPRSTILAGSLADADFDFTADLLDRGVGGNFDAWSVHPYSEDRSPLHPGVPGWTQLSFARGVPAVHETLLEHGERKPIWLTEFGWSTCTTRNSNAWDNCVDEGVQATYLRQAFSKMRDWRYVPVGITFNLEDTSTDRSDRVDNYGLLASDGTPKPAYRALAGAAQTLAAGPRRARAPLSVRIFRRGRRAFVAGRLPAGRMVRVKLRRMSRRTGRPTNRVAYTRLLRVGRDGRFRHRVRLAAAASGSWKVVAKVRRRPRLAARAVVS